MTSRSHMLDGYLGQRMVNSLPTKPRRKSKDELEAMTSENRLHYEINHPPTEAEKWEELEREMRDHGADLTGEIDAQDLLDNHPPPDWGV
jgi:hypothetical protein